MAMETPVSLQGESRQPSSGPSALRGAVLRRHKLLHPSPLSLASSLARPMPRHHSGSTTAETKSAAPSEGIIKVQRLWRGPSSVEQVFNFKLTRLGACAGDSPIGKTDGWPGSPAGEQEQEEGRGAELWGRGTGRKLSRRTKGPLGALEVCALGKPKLWASSPATQRDVEGGCSPCPSPPPGMGAESNPAGQASFLAGSQSMQRTEMALSTDLGGALTVPVLPSPNGRAAPGARTARTLAS